MVEPAKGVTCSIYGNVKFKTNDVKDWNSTRVQDKSGNTKVLYTVELNDGTKVTYPSQPLKNEATVKHVNGLLFFNGIQDVTVDDTPNDDKYRFNNCSGVVNAKREVSIPISPSETAGDKYTITSAIDRDIITLTNSPRLEVNYSPGFDQLYK